MTSEIPIELRHRINDLMLATRAVVIMRSSDYRPASVEPWSDAIWKKLLTGVVRDGLQVIDLIGSIRTPLPEQQEAWIKCGLIRMVIKVMEVLRSETKTSELDDAAETLLESLFSELADYKFTREWLKSTPRPLHGTKLHIVQIIREHGPVTEKEIAMLLKKDYGYELRYIRRKLTRDFQREHGIIHRKGEGYFIA